MISYVNLPAALRRRGSQEGWREGKLERCPRPYFRLDMVTGERRHVPCCQRRCPWCGENIWKKRRTADYFAGVKGVGLDRLKLVTVTAPGGGLDCEAWNVGAAERFHDLVTMLREEYPQLDLQYWKVGEFQVRGALHYHVIVRACRNLFIEKKTLEKLAVHAGFGKVCFVNSIDPRKGGINGACAYLASYLLQDVEAWPNGKPVVTKSHRWRLVWEDRRPAKEVGRWRWFPSLSALWSAVFEEDLRWTGGTPENRGPTLALQPTL